MHTLWTGIKVVWTTTTLVCMEGVLAGLNVLDHQKKTPKTKLLPLEEPEQKP